MSTDWHYTIKGERRGPVSRDEIRRLVDEGTLGAGDLVWQAGADAWLPIARTDLVVSEGVPPLPVQAINNIYLWLIILVPLISSVAEKLVSLSGASLSPHVSWWLSFLLNIGFLAGDRQKLRQAGHEPPKMILGFLFILMPVYLFARARRFGRGGIYVLFWILAVGAAVAVDSLPGPTTGSLPDSDDPPRLLRKHLPDCAHVDDLLHDIIVEDFDAKVISIHDQAEVSRSGTGRGQIVSCTGEFDLSTGTRHLPYTIRWDDYADDQFIVRLQFR